MNTFQLIREDFYTHDRDLLRPGFHALCVFRFGQWRMKIRFRWLRLPFSLIYKLAFAFVRNFYGIELPYSVILGRRVKFEHQHGIVIHGASVIGDDCIIRQGVTVGNRYMTKPDEAPVIGKRVSIGAGAKLLGRIFVGDDANVGANAVVLVDVPTAASVVGIPARMVKTKQIPD